MEFEEKDKLTSDGSGQKSRYCVLFTQTLKQWEVTRAIQRRLPQNRGTVFYPCVELWMGSLGQTVIQPLFPGYVFIRSDMRRDELHEFIKSRRREVLSFIKELHLSEDGAVWKDDTLEDLSEEEADFLDFMLGFRYREEERIPEDGYFEVQAPETAKSGKRIWNRKIPASGVMAMSYGYREKNGGYIVMEGPLRGLESHIVDVNLKDRRAYLNLKVGGRLARAGLEIKSKRYWYPKDKDAPVMLSDGTEINIGDIAAAMMGHKG